MVSWLIKKLSKFRARLVSAKNDNRLPNKKKPDIFMQNKGKKYYLDVGFSNDEDYYHNVKVNTY